jgi:LuxR family maltose regulon positive regulatory protein
MSTPILATKLYIPPLRPEFVPRPRLIERLNEGSRAGRKLTLISAPAGFGKTTLVSSWIYDLRFTIYGLQAETASQEKIANRVAWLSLDEGDNDPTRFLTYLVAALQTIAPTIGAEVLGLLHSSQPPPVESILTTLLNDLTTVLDNPSTGPAQGFVLVLDDSPRRNASEIADRPLPGPETCHVGVSHVTVTLRLGVDLSEVRSSRSGTQCPASDG